MAGVPRTARCSPQRLDDPSVQPDREEIGVRPTLLIWPFPRRPLVALIEKGLKGRRHQ